LSYVTNTYNTGATCSGLAVVSTGIYTRSCSDQVYGIYPGVYGDVIASPPNFFVGGATLEK
jgi:hypothetical protein